MRWLFPFPTVLPRKIRLSSQIVVIKTNPCRKMPARGFCARLDQWPDLRGGPSSPSAFTKQREITHQPSTGMSQHTPGLQLLRWASHDAPAQLRAGLLHTSTWQQEPPLPVCKAVKPSRRAAAERWWFGGLWHRCHSGVTGFTSLQTSFLRLTPVSSEKYFFWPSVFQHTNTIPSAC